MVVVMVEPKIVDGDVLVVDKYSGGGETRNGDEFQSFFLCSLILWPGANKKQCCFQVANAIGRVNKVDA